MLIKNFYNLYDGLGKTKKYLKKNSYKDYIAYLFSYLFLLLFILYSVEGALAAIHITTEKKIKIEERLDYKSAHYKLGRIYLYNKKKLNKANEHFQLANRNNKILGKLNKQNQKVIHMGSE